MSQQEIETVHAAPSHPVDVLKREHDVILQVLEALHREVARGGMPRLSFWVEALPFFEDYADRWHHGKEEDLLVPALAEWGLPLGMGPIAVMEQQHVEARSLLSAMRAGLRSAAAAEAELRPAAVRYVDLMREHIAIENDVLFEMARHTLPAAEVPHLLRRFGQAEAALGAAFATQCLERARAACAVAGAPFTA